MTEKSEAIQIAQALELMPELVKTLHFEAAAELRRLTEVNQELVEALEDIVGMYDYEASCGDLASRLYEAKCLALAAIAKARGEG